MLHLAAGLELSPLAQKLLSGRVRGSFYALRHINKRDSYGRTPLEYAVEQRHVGLTRLLLKNRAKMYVRDVQKPWQKRSPALWTAFESGDEEMVKLLLDFNAKVDSWLSDRKYRISTPLALASRSGHEGTVRLLMGLGADIKFPTRYKRLYLRLKFGRNISFKFDSLLTEVSRKGHEPIVRLLLENGADVNTRHMGNSLALIEASYYGHESIVRLLLENGADVNARTADKSSALHVASFRGHESSMRLLLEKGADINARDLMGESALIRALRHDYASIVRLLLEKGADINIQSERGISALMKASSKGYESIVRLLLENGADINATDHHNNSALMLINPDLIYSMGSGHLVVSSKT